MSDSISEFLLMAILVVAVVVFIFLFFVSAPYGRYFRSNFGPAINGKIGWIIMEAPAPLLFAALFISSLSTVNVILVMFLIMWQIHYIDRAFIYPLTIRISSKPFPLFVLAAGFAFNVINAYLNSSYIIMNSTKYTELWLHDFRFIFGLCLFIIGFIINRHSDYVLYRTRLTSKKEYNIPQGGLYQWISCPNYLGEIMIWLGWTFATWSPVAAAFSLWTVANLVPRARSHHRWYRQHFENYPIERRALIPRVW